MASTKDTPEAEPSIINIDGVGHTVEDIRSTGDIILDVSFENTSACNKSIPSDEIRKLRTSNTPIPSPRIFYRVRLATLKKSSNYFEHLLGPRFAEGRSINEQYANLASLNLNPTEIVAGMLPRIKIVDEDVATKTLGREKLFGDMLRIIHGAVCSTFKKTFGRRTKLLTDYQEHTTKPINLQSLTILVVMADRYNTVPPIARYFQKTFINFKYPVAVDKKAEECLLQKILIFYHTEQALRFTAATRELILRGSSRWAGGEESENDFQTAWWDLPDGLEGKTCIVPTPQERNFNITSS